MKNLRETTILDDLKCGNFRYEFLPEDENFRELFDIKWEYLLLSKTKKDEFPSFD